MSSAELTFWWQAYQSEFLGDERDDWRMGTLASEVANMSGMVLKEGVTRTSSDYMRFTTAAKKKRTRKYPTRKQLETKLEFLFGPIPNKPKEEKPKKSKGKKGKKGS
jgi:hypothetical protein